jgi:lipoprotein signal peptidase
LISGGAIGNLIDRIRLGYVIDFIEWYAGNLRWPTFNIADSAISTGVALIVLGMLVDLFRSKKSKEPARPDLSDDAGKRPLASSMSVR